MKRYLILAAITLAAITSKADDFSEQAKVAGFRCDYGKAVLHLRSLEADRALYLASNTEGEPKPFEMLEEHCKGLIKNLGNRLTGKVLDVDFQVDTFSRKESVYVPPRNPCRPGRTKCDDEGDYVERIFNYVRTQTVIDGYRFFSEERTR